MKLINPIRRAAAAASALFAVFAFSLCPTALAEDDGAYTAATNTYYLNPDTGVTDDGGSKNAALGEGMCRSVVYKDALVEFDGDKIYATVRLQLMSNMKDFRLYVQDGAGGNYTKESPRSYSKVKPRIMAEDAGADTADYRFEIPSVTAYMSWEMYVIPMGRDVKFYMNLSDNLTPGGEDFIVSVKPKASPAPTAAPEPEPEPSSAPASPESPPASAASPSSPPSETSPPEPDAAPSETPVLAITPAPEETGQEPPEVSEAPDVTPAPSAAPEPSPSPAPEETPEPASEATPESTPAPATAMPGASDEPIEDERQSGAGGIVIAAAVIAVAVSAVIAVPRIVRRRK